ncbi:hypothetical protein LTR53_001210 [Teratosphaeriaceae sp. CCFEE 6253]|nr:hypothetical protein LTR53_001210 [Teratosphaeriaceae sp. CCFEE 6253]
MAHAIATGFTYCASSALFPQERASLGLRYDEALKEEMRLERLYYKAQERRHHIEEDFARSVSVATTRLLYLVIDVTELRDAIFAHLLPGEVAAFYTGCGLDAGGTAVVAALHPLRVIVSDDTLLETMHRDGYNLTIIGESKDELLYGLSGLPFVYDYATRGRRSRHWSAILVATKEKTFVLCSAAFLPLSAFRCPGVEADAAEDAVDETGTLRIVTLRYGPDVMSIWMPLLEQPTTLPVAIPQKVFHDHVKILFKPDWRHQPQMFYAHLADERSLVRGPLRLVDTNESDSRNDTFTIKVDLSTDRFRGIGSVQYSVP